MVYISVPQHRMNSATTVHAAPSLRYMVAGAMLVWSVLTRGMLRSATPRGIFSHEAGWHGAMGCLVRFRHRNFH